MNELLQTIAQASAEQAQGVGQVNTGITELDKVIQSNAGNSEERSAAAEETSAQSTNMSNLVAQFKVTDQKTADPGSGPLLRRRMSQLDLRLFCFKLGGEGCLLPLAA